jgi:hypothetical protein
MSSVRFQFEGLAELRQALRNLPDELTAEASRIVEGAANGAVADIGTVYAEHRRSGNLAKGLRVTHFEGGKFSAGAIVKNTSPHASWFDAGTQTRQTKIGADRGAMPPTWTFVRGITRARRLMWTQLKELLVRKGLLVSGDA